MARPVTGPSTVVPTVRGLLADLRPEASDTSCRLHDPRPVDRHVYTPGQLAFMEEVVARRQPLAVPALAIDDGSPDGGSSPTGPPTVTTAVVTDEGVVRERVGNNAPAGPVTG